MNIVEFALKFKDMATPQLDLFGKHTNTTLRTLSNLTDTLSGRNRMLGAIYNEISAKIQIVENQIKNSRSVSEIRSLRREFELLQNQQSKSISGKALGGSFTGGGLRFGKLAGGMVLGNLAAGAIMQIGSMAKDFVGDSIGKNFERQQLRTSFDVLTGSEAAGGAITKQLLDLQKDTILGGGVFKNAQTMMGFGISASEVADNIKMLGDVSMGSKERMESLTLAFSQSSAAGRLMGQDLLQFINAGFNPLQYISEKTGKSIGELKEEMADGKISFAMVKEAFIDATSEGGKFNNMLEKIAEKPVGQLEKLKGWWSEFSIQIGGAFEPLTVGVLKLAQKMIPLLEGLITPLANGIQQAVDWVQKLVGSTADWAGWLEPVKTLFCTAWDYAKFLFGTVFRLVEKIVGFVKQSVILQTIFQAIVGVVRDYLYPVLKGLVEFVEWVVNAVLKLLTKIDDLFKSPKKLQVVVSNAPTGKEEKKADTNTELLRKTELNTRQNAESASEKESKVTGGGPRIVNISVQKFLDNINLYTTNLQEGAAEIEQKILEVFGRVVVQAAYAQ